jgi:hypothetical protein
VKLDRSAAKMPTLREGILMGAGSLKPLSNLRMVGFESTPSANKLIRLRSPVAAGVRPCPENHAISSPSQACYGVHAAAWVRQQPAQGDGYEDG